MLVSFFRFLRYQLNAVLGTTVNVPRHSAVRRIHFLELIQTITNGSGVPLYPAFAGKWVENERGRTGFVAFPEISVGIPSLFRGSGRALGLASSLLIGGWLLG